MIQKNCYCVSFFGFGFKHFEIVELLFPSWLHINGNNTNIIKDQMIWCFAVVCVFQLERLVLELFSLLCVYEP